MTGFEQLVWCAGFMDGEGCIYAHHNVLTVRVTQKFRQPLEIFVRTFNTGAIYEQHNTNFGKVNTMLMYRVNGRKAGEILELMLPYLVVKKSQAILAIEFATTYNDPHPDWNRRSEICQQLKELKKSGR